MSKKHFLKEYEWGVIPISNYRGCLVTKLIGGYEVHGKKCLTEDDVDNIIDSGLASIKKSIKKPTKK